MKAKVLCEANFKGGVGKTSTTALIGYNMAKRLGYKVLLIDYDPQANLTNLCMKTAAINSDNLSDNITIKNTLMNTIVNNIPIEDIIIPIIPNLDLIPNAVDFAMYTRYLERNYDNELDKVSFLQKLIMPLKSKYDYIFIDVPPTLSLLNDTAFMACDYISVILQTQERALEGAKVFINYLIESIKKEFNSPVEVVGILPVLTKSGVAVDKEVLEMAIETWGKDWVFTNVIQLMERVKRIDMTGITDNSSDIHDKRMHEKYTKVAEELISQIEYLEEE